MRIEGIPFGTTNWSEIDPTHHAGTKGSATWRTQTFGIVRVRMVEYSPGYEADHWCNKGHILRMALFSMAATSSSVSYMKRPQLRG
jgi:hypothetical protein